jgi:hypothetical protein
MGSDFPTVDQLKNAVAIIKKAKTTTRAKKKVMGDNARKLFGHVETTLTARHIEVKDVMSRSDSPTTNKVKEEHWWEFCPVCGSKLINHKCRFVCSNPQCHFFMSCSEFDL